jgi:class 3 adenylate cyclase
LDLPQRRPNLVFQLVVSVLLLAGPAAVAVEIANFDRTVANTILPQSQFGLERQRQDQATRTLAFGRADEILADSIDAAEIALAEYGQRGKLVAAALMALALLVSAFGLLLVWRSATRPDARALAIVLAILCVLGFTDSAAPHSELLLFAFPFLFAAILRFAAQFPMPLDERDILTGNAAVNRRGFRRLVRVLGWPQIVLLKPAVVWGAATAISSTFLLLSFGVRRVAWWLTAWAPSHSMQQRYELLRTYMRVLAPVFGGMLIVLLIAFLIGITVTLRYLRIGFRKADAPQKRRAIWVTTGFYVYFCIFLTIMLLNSLILHRFVEQSRWPFAEHLMLATGETIALAALIGCAVVAVIQHDVFASGILLRKTTLYAAMSVILLALFSGLEQIASVLLADVLNMSESAGAWVAGSVIAITFGPLHSTLQRATTRVFDRLLPATALAAEGERQDVIVVFSDLVGYTAQSAQDPASALTLAALFHKEARANTERLGGRLVKKIGDAVLLQFSDAANALVWAAEISHRMEAGCRVLDLPDPLLRTGIHAGEVVRSVDGDLYGSTVNIAARLQTRAGPGETLISREVVNRAADVVDGYLIEPLGDLRLKNLPNAVETFRCSPRLQVA